MKVAEEQYHETNSDVAYELYKKLKYKLDKIEKVVKLKEDRDSKSEAYN